jgi:hypothetical protein
LVRGQVAEFVLDAPEFVEHGASVPLALHHNVAPSPAIVTAKVLSGDDRSAHLWCVSGCFPHVPHCQLISRDGMGISNQIAIFLNYCSISFDHEARNTLLSPQPAADVSGCISLGLVSRSSPPPPPRLRR